MTPDRAVRVQAPAKVNLFLRVLAKRPDGFHDIETLFQAVDLCDEVRVARRPGGIRLTVDGPDLGPPEENLAFRAARDFLAAADVSPAGVDIHLTKNIPAGAGLGGGSSDAAAVLRCMATLWPGTVPTRRLKGIAAGLGSDVPFFLGSGARALGRGRGEALVVQPALPTGHLVLVLPPVHVATVGAYGALSARRREGGAAAYGTVWPETGADDWATVGALAVNDFEEVVPQGYVQVSESLQALRVAGGRPTLLSGSGAACFGVFPSGDQAAAVAADLTLSLGWPALHVRTLSDMPGPEEAAPSDGSRASDDRGAPMGHTSGDGG